MRVLGIFGAIVVASYTFSQCHWRFKICYLTESEAQMFNPTAVAVLDFPPDSARLHLRQPTAKRWGLCEDRDWAP